MRLFGSDRVASIMDRMGIEEGEVITAGMITRAISNAQGKVEVRNYGVRKHLLEYDDVMNQQRQVIYDIRTDALTGENTRQTVLNIIDDYIEDEITLHSEAGLIDDWDWTKLKQNLSSHILVDINKKALSNELNGLETPDVIKWIKKEALSVYKNRESLIPEDVIRGFERFVILRTIDEKWKDHLYAMDQLREGINLRAYGQKNPLLEYKSEGFSMFQDMMGDMNAVTIQRIFRTKLQGMDRAPELQTNNVKNIKTEHEQSDGLSFLNQEQRTQSDRSNKSVISPIKVEKKIGRNEKVIMISLSGERVEIKYKKIDSYLKKGFKKV